MCLAECLMLKFTFVRYNESPEMQIRIIEKEIDQSKIKINAGR